MNLLRILCLLAALALISSCSRPSVQGRYIKATPATESSGWRTLDFKPDGTVVVNDDATGIYRIEKGNIIIQGGAMTFVGKVSGEDLVFDRETYKKQK